MIENQHFCGLYQIKLKSANLLTISLCVNLLDWIDPDKSHSNEQNDPE